jgi:transposase
MPNYEATDPHLAELRKLAKKYQNAVKQAEAVRENLDTVIQELKRDGYSYPVLAKHTRLSQGTIQNIVAKGETWD